MYLFFFFKKSRYHKCSLHWPLEAIVFPLQTPQAMWANLAPVKNIPDIMCLWLCPKIGTNARGFDLNP